MMPIKDLTGKRFGRLTALNLAGQDRLNKALWRCRCDCGTTLTVRSSSLTRTPIFRAGRIYNPTKSCGCYPKGRAAVQFQNLVARGEAEAP